MIAIDIIGGGPAGTAAALAALADDCAVRVFEKSIFPRHKVCGEFLSPEIAEILQQLGAWHAFQHAGPARIRRVALHLGNREKRWALSEPGFGLSRYVLDSLLMECAVRSGAVVIREKVSLPARRPTVLAHGRQWSAKYRPRLFGFKAHYQGPVDDVVSLFFFGDSYVGLSAIENGLTNVCGLAPEDRLHRWRFEIDALLETFRPLADRLRPLERIADWLTTGPLVFGHINASADVYPAGDAAGFIDPFTGTGIVSALLTGTLAGKAAARNIPVSDHLGNCRKALGSQYMVSEALRWAVRRGLAQKLGPLIPGKMMFHFTRPRLVD